MIAETPSDGSPNPPVPELERRLAQQALIAEFGRYALRQHGLDAILSEACRIAADGLGSRADGGEGVEFQVDQAHRPGAPRLRRDAGADDLALGPAAHREHEIGAPERQLQRGLAAQPVARAGHDDGPAAQVRSGQMLPAKRGAGACRSGPDHGGS